MDRSGLSLYSNTSPNTDTLTATVTPSDATDKSVTWQSDNPAVATVDQSGNVTAVSNGTALIAVTTTDGGYTASCTVTVSTYRRSGGDALVRRHHRSRRFRGDHPRGQPPVTNADGSTTLPGNVVATIPGGSTVAPDGNIRVGAGGGTVTKENGAKITAPEGTVIDKDGTVKRAITGLVKSGHLSKEQRWRENGGKSSNIYYVR